MYHFFCFRVKEDSPIQGLKTDLTIELKNSDLLKIHFTRIEKKTTVTMLDERDEEDIIDTLKNKGIIDNFLLRLNFISQNEENDQIYGDNLKLSNFFELNKKYFLDNRDFELSNRFSEIIKEQNSYFENILKQKSQVNLAILNLGRNLEKNVNILKNIQEFIDNYEEIKKFIQFVKVDKNLTDLNTKKKELQEKIYEFETKIKNLNQIKKFDSTYTSQQKKIKPQIKGLYIDYEPLCPICSNYVSLNTFKGRFNSEICYLCGDSIYDYIEKEESIIRTEEAEKGDVKDIKSIQYELNNKKNDLIKEKEELLDKIREYKQYTRPIDENIKKIIDENYLDLTRPRFSINEEFHRKLELKNHYSELIKNQKELFEKHNHKIKIIEDKESIVKKIIDILQKSFFSFKKKMDEKIEDLFKKFIKQLRFYWGKLTNEPIKTIIYDDTEALLKIGAVSTTGTPFKHPLTSLKIKKEEQRHFSKSQSNALRYALHFSLIKILYEKFGNFPLKTIFIDEPASGIKERLYKLIEEDFIKSYNFQFIILSTIKEDPFNDWKEEIFPPYDRYFRVKSKEVQRLISEYW